MKYSRLLMGMQLILLVTILIKQTTDAVKENNMGFESPALFPGGSFQASLLVLQLCKRFIKDEASNFVYAKWKFKITDDLNKKTHNAVLITGVLLGIPQLILAILAQQQIITSKFFNDASLLFIAAAGHLAVPLFVFCTSCYLRLTKPNSMEGGAFTRVADENNSL